MYIIELYHIHTHFVHLIVLQRRVYADEVCLGVIVLAPASGLAPGHLALARQVAGVGLHRPAVLAAGGEEILYYMLVYNRNCSNILCSN